MAGNTTLRVSMLFLACQTLVSAVLNAEFFRYSYACGQRKTSNPCFIVQTIKGNSKMIAQAKKLRHKTGSVLGGFGKAIENSVSLNFGVSGGDDCDTKCRMHPDYVLPDHLKPIGLENKCYALTTEKRFDRKQLADKLVRHSKMNPAMICGRAIIEVQDVLRREFDIPWFRFCTNGPLPKVTKARKNKLFLSQLRKLVELLVANNIPVHLPVETHAKAKFYRSIVGDLIEVRESLQDVKRFNTAKGSVSFVVGVGTLPERIEQARAAAKARTDSTGRKTIVCPAVVAGFQKKLKNRGLNIVEKEDLKARYSKQKCGACKACAQNVDVVYPSHS